MKIAWQKWTKPSHTGCYYRRNGLRKWLKYENIEQSNEWMYAGNVISITDYISNDGFNAFIEWSTHCQSRDHGRNCFTERLNKI